MLMSWGDSLQAITPAMARAQLPVLQHQLKQQLLLLAWPVDRQVAANVPLHPMFHEGGPARVPGGGASSHGAQTAGYFAGRSLLHRPGNPVPKQVCSQNILSFSSRTESGLGCPRRLLGMSTDACWRHIICQAYWAPPCLLRCVGLEPLPLGHIKVASAEGVHCHAGNPSASPAPSSASLGTAYSGPASRCSSPNPSLWESGSAAHSPANSVMGEPHWGSRLGLPAGVWEGNSPASLRLGYWLPGKTAPLGLALHTSACVNP